MSKGSDGAESCVACTWTTNGGVSLFLYLYVVV